MNNIIKKTSLAVLTFGATAIVANASLSTGIHHASSPAPTDPSQSTQGPELTLYFSESAHITLKNNLPLAASTRNANSAVKMNSKQSKAKQALARNSSASAPGVLKGNTSSANTTAVTPTGKSRKASRQSGHPGRNGIPAGITPDPALGSPDDLAVFPDAPTPGSGLAEFVLGQTESVPVTPWFVADVTSPDYGSQDITVVSVPEPTTVFAGALLLLPLGASMVRTLRRNKQAKTSLHA